MSSNHIGHSHQQQQQQSSFIQEDSGSVGSGPSDDRQKLNPSFILPPIQQSMVQPQRSAFEGGTKPQSLPKITSGRKNLNSKLGHAIASANPVNKKPVGRQSMNPYQQYDYAPPFSKHNVTEMSAGNLMAHSPSNSSVKQFQLRAKSKPRLGGRGIENQDDSRNINMSRGTQQQTLQEYPTYENLKKEVDEVDKLSPSKKLVLRQDVDESIQDMSRIIGGESLIGNGEIKRPFNSMHDDDPMEQLIEHQRSMMKELDDDYQ
ncbi:hypothetical protein FGO68_gene4440 [Halteria grandinella]|uniref:Uncharacterized protein n=1 Tax=Halteria grandinella TaxID=5974 RepID=A0A8J8P3F8_HALGN|nr:hypothetical protein FGO68_gene4440 [Halteria grandinella]